MSRVAKAGVKLPEKVQLTITEKDMVLEGPKGKLTQHYNKLVSIENVGNVVSFKPANNAPTAWAQAGTARALLNNMLKGVTEGFKFTLEFVGVGYRVQVNGKTLVLSLGYSHPVEYKLPEQVMGEAPNNTTLVLSGIDKQLLGQIASEIRAFRPPEPYKGKGIKYAGEMIARKEAKKK